MSHRQVVAALALAVSLLCGFCYREGAVSPYEERFHQTFPPRTLKRDLDQFASVQLFDQKYLSWRPQTLSNDEGQLAWGVSYRLAALNEMFRATGERKYLQESLSLARLVLDFTDQRQGLTTKSGQSGPVWSSLSFSQGRAVHLVHTAMITHAILETLLLLEEEHPAILQAVERSLDYHQTQWRDGPGPHEGYFVYTAEQSETKAGQVLPINRSCAMAKSLWLKWKLTGDEESRERALAVGRYFKNRLHLTPDGGYTWPYLMPLSRTESAAVGAEDTSHAALTASLVPLLHAESQVFDEQDMGRFVTTVKQGVLSESEGVVAGDLRGELSDPAQVALPARWLVFSPFEPQIYDSLAQFYIDYDVDPNPYRMSLAMALLIRFRKVQEQDFSPPNH